MGQFALSSTSLPFLSREIEEERGRALAALGGGPPGHGGGREEEEKGEDDEGK